MTESETHRVQPLPRQTQSGRQPATGEQVVYRSEHPADLRHALDVLGRS
jgi:hypothetical protein